MSFFLEIRILLSLRHWLVIHLFLRYAWNLRHRIALILLRWLLLISISRTFQGVLFNDYFLGQSHLGIEMIVKFRNISARFRRRWRLNLLILFMLGAIVFNMSIQLQIHLLLCGESTRCFALSGKCLILHLLFHSQRRCFLQELYSVIYLIPGATNSLLSNFWQFLFLFIALIKHFKFIDLKTCLLILLQYQR